MSKNFLGIVRELSCWKSSSNDLIPHFSGDTEILFAVLYSIIVYSSEESEIQESDLKDLRLFASNSGISDPRQREIIRKIQIADWHAKDVIRETGIKLFISDFVQVCLQDKKITPIEYRLIYLIGKYLNLKKSDISEMLRDRLSQFRYKAIIFFENPFVSTLITIFIILNAIQLGLMTCDWFTPYKGRWFYHLDFAFICLFTIELLCRIYAFRKDFFRESQNVFDFVLIAISWIPAPGFRWISAFRILRAMRLPL